MTLELIINAKKKKNPHIEFNPLIKVDQYKQLLYNTQQLLLSKYFSNTFVCSISAGTCSGFIARICG
jgi:hypothetical protein